MNPRSLAIALTVMLISSCDNPFSPRGPFTPQLVVYSVISNSRNSQFVRVYSTYNPPELNPYEYLEDSALTNAVVQMNGYAFRDTLLPRVNAGDTTMIFAYTSDLPIVHANSYVLRVSSPTHGSVLSRITVPDAPAARFLSTAVLDYPSQPPPPRVTRQIIFPIGLSSLARAYLVRMFIEFQTVQGSDTMRLRWEVPQYGPTDTSFSDAMYPSVRYADRPAFEVSFPESAYVKTLARIVYRYTVLVKFTQVVVEVTQLGESLHTYSSVVNGFQDELSLRLDQPDYSNISGGVGLFGVYTRNEFTRPFPQDFFYNPAPR